MMKNTIFKFYNHKGFNILVRLRKDKVWFDISEISYLLGLSHQPLDYLCDSYIDDIKVKDDESGLFKITWVSERAIYALILESLTHDRAYDLCIFILSNIIPDIKATNKADITAFMAATIDVPTRLGMEVLEAMTWLDFGAINIERVQEKAREAVSSFIAKRCVKTNHIATKRQALYKAYLEHIGSNGGGSAAMSEQFFHSLVNEIYADCLCDGSYYYRCIQLKEVA